LPPRRRALTHKFRSPVNEPISRTSSPPYHLPTLPCSLLYVAATPAVSAASSAGDYRRTSSPPHHLPTLSCSRVATPAVSAAPTRPLVIAAHVPSCISLRSLTTPAAVLVTLARTVPPCLPILVTPSPMLFLSRDDESFRRRDPQDLALKILRSTFDSSTITGLPESSRPGVRVIYD